MTFGLSLNAQKTPIRCMLWVDFMASSIEEVQIGCQPKKENTCADSDKKTTP